LGICENFIKDFFAHRSPSDSHSSIFVKSFFLPTFLALTCTVWCQTPTQDFSKGFELLASLGLPPLASSSTWARVTDSNRMDYNIREYTRSIKGNGWLIKAQDGSLRHIMLGNLAETSMPEKSKEPPPQDLAKDVQSIIDALNKSAKKKDPDEIFSEYRYSSLDPFLIFATQLHQTGHKDLANQLALATFAFYPTRDSAIDAVIHRIAGHHYRLATSAFHSSGDWSAYHRSLATLADRYPRGWNNLGAVRFMLPQLERQAKGESAPEPSLPGITLEPKAVAILNELMRPPKKDGNPEKLPDNPPPHVRRHMMEMQAMGHDFEYDGSGFSQYLWIIPIEHPKGTDPQSRLAALGMAAIPALAAVVEDPFFTHLPNPGTDRDHYYYSSSESEDDRILRAYQSLTRPATRGEIACRMLTLALPDPQNELHRADPLTLRDLALEFWKSHNVSTPDQLAAAFLKEGSEQQVSQVVGFLAKSKNPETHKLFESHVLAADPAIAWFESVRTYLKERQTEGKPFFDQYAQLVRKQSADLVSIDEDERYGRASWRIKQAGGPEKILKQLQSVAEGESPRAMAIRIGKEESMKTARASINALAQTISDDEPRKQLITLLSGAYAAAQNAHVRAQFLTAIFRIDWNTNDENDDPDDEDAREDEDTPRKPAPRTISAAETKVWQRLIADSRPLDSGARGNEISTVSALACSALESTITGYGYYELMQAMPIIARPAADVLAERAKARLAGKPVPDLPNAENIPQERLAAIVSQASELPPAEIHPYLLTLSIDERAAWSTWLQDPGDIPIPANVKQLRHQVIKHSEFGEYSQQTIPDLDAIPVGFQVSEKSIADLLQTLASQTDRYSRSVIALRPTAFGPGIEVASSVLPMPTPKNDDEDEDEDEDSNPHSRIITADMVFRNSMRHFLTDEDPDALITTSISGQRSQANWSVKNGRATLQLADGEPNTFSDALKAALESQDPRALRLQIGILNRADAKILNSTNE